MGLLDKKIKVSFIDGKVSEKEVFDLLNEKLSKKYKVEFLKKGNALSQMAGKQSFDSVLVAKNAYHRTLISCDFISKEESLTKDETIIHLNKATLKGWLQFLYNQMGFLGSLVIDLIYGKSKEFDKEITDALESKYEIQQKTIDVGLSTILKR